MDIYFPLNWKSRICFKCETFIVELMNVEHSKGISNRAESATIWSEHY